MRLPARLVRTLGVGPVALLLGCTNAPGTEEGGDARFDAAAPVVVTADDAGGCGDPNADAGFGSGWSDLYRDYFGATGVASCAGTAGQCHGDSSGLGAQGSGGYVCATESACYASMTSPSLDLVTVGDTKDDPTVSTLYLTLRKACGGGSMPKQPASFTFSAADMKRIADWIGAGAPNN